MVKNKKHIFVIVSCLLAVMVAIMPLLTINSKKTTAKADGVISNNFLVCIPSFYFNYNGDENCVMPTMFLNVSSDYSHVTLYFCYSPDSQSAYYTAETHPIDSLVHTNVSIHHIRPQLDADGLLTTRYADNAVSGQTSYIRFTGNFRLINSATRVIVAPVTDSNPSAGHGFHISFYDQTQDLYVCAVDILNYNGTLTFATDRYLFNYTTIAAPVELDDLSSYLYDTGYTAGYNKGYNAGLNTTWKDLSPWQVLVNGVNDFLNADLFGNVSLRILLMCGMGVMLVLLLFKLVR